MTDLHPNFKYADSFAQKLEKQIQPNVQEVKNGKFVTEILDGTFPLEGIKFWIEQTYHLVMNDMGNLSLYVTKARNLKELDFFLFMTIAEKMMLESHYLLLKAANISNDRLADSQPALECSYRTNYFSKLAITAKPGEIALGILLNFPVWAAGARALSKGLKKNYGFGKSTTDPDKLDTDVLDRFSKATRGFQIQAIDIIAADLNEETEESMAHVGNLAVDYETLVWKNYYVQGIKSQ